MPLYDYRAIDDYGKSHDGQLKAENEKDLEKKLAEKGYYLLEAKEVRAIVKASKPVKKASKPVKDVLPEFHNKITEGAKEVHFHQHVHQSPEPPKPSRLETLDRIGRGLQAIGAMIILLVSGFFFFSIFSLVVYLLYPAKSKASNPQAIQTKKEPTLVSSEKRISGDQWFGCADREELKKLIGYAADKDTKAFQEAILRGLLLGTITSFKDGEEVYLQKAEIFSGLIKVRRKGETEEYWTSFEAVK